MIRDGRSQGWLSLPASNLEDWADLHGVVLSAVHVRSVPGCEDRGSALVCNRDIALDEHRRHNPGPALMTIPQALILSIERVHGHAKIDQNFAVVLHALGEFGKSPRISILSFLLYTCFQAHPSAAPHCGITSAFTDYVKFLPLNTLPTSWPDADLEIANCTSLYAASKAKLRSLYREFDQLRSATEKISWCAELWWNEVDGVITFDDWLQVDAMYRSRALDHPVIGHCMIPCLDMANHAGGDDTRAMYDVDDNGDAQLRPLASIKSGQEVTITYGDDKGACEMLFSYGFLEDGVETARELFLDLHFFEHDPLRKPKAVLSTMAPGFKIVQTQQGTIDWEGPFVLLMCIDQDNGLNFRLRQTVDGDQELVPLWYEEEVASLDEVIKRVRDGPMWDVVCLRAVSVVQDRVGAQLQLMVDSEEEADRLEKDQATASNRPRQLALKLRALEYDLLGSAYGHLEDLKIELADKESVKSYLAAMSEAEPDQQSAPANSQYQPSQQANDHETLR